jgi:ATP-dependent DNA ligase
MTCAESRLRCASRRWPACCVHLLPRVQFNAHLAHRGDVVFAHACKMGLEGIVSKRLGSRYRSGRTSDWLKFKNPEAPAVRREAEEEWGR